MNTITLPATITGQRHSRSDFPCGCGCTAVVGLEGAVVRDDDTPKFLSLEEPLLIAEFDVPCPAGGPSRPTQVAYSLAELEL